MRVLNVAPSTPRLDNAPAGKTARLARAKPGLDSYRERKSLTVIPLSSLFSSRVVSFIVLGWSSGIRYLVSVFVTVLYTR